MIKHLTIQTKSKIQVDHSQPQSEMSFNSTRRVTLTGHPEKLDVAEQLINKVILGEPLPPRYAQRDRVQNVHYNQGGGMGGVRMPKPSCPPNSGPEMTVKVRLDEERSDEIITPLISAKIAHARTSVQDAPLPN
jgi:hypothetical protein